ncbi:MAG: ComEC/Rec2 family competence protein [Salinivirgaceae bacterium]
MSFFKGHPFIRFLLPLIAGIVSRYYFNLSFQISFGILLIFAITFYGFYAIQLSYRWHYLKGIAVTGFIYSIGLLLTGNQLTNHIGNSNNEKDALWFVGKITTLPIEKEKTLKTEIHVKSQLVGNEWKVQDAKLLVLLEKDSASISLKAGQQLLFKTQISKKLQGTNPFGFDYQRYLSLKQIESTIYLKSTDWKLIEVNPQGIFEKALNLRNYLISVFEIAGIKGDELAVLSALTLGYQNSMDAKIRDAYTGAGAVHILSVSGSHVAIIFVMLSFIFKGIPVISKNSKMKYVIIIIALWAYAFITGLSPSVCRASVMFTFVLFGYLLKKRINIYNSMAASAVFLLIINPLWLFDIGFQLSYTAVFGIVFLYPKIYNQWYIKNKIGDYMWSLTAVSIAAQLVATPLSLYYFHIFPTYFWLSNIVVVIAATILINLAILLLAVSKIPFLVHALGYILNYILLFTNGFVEWINTLPYARIENIPMNGFMLLLIYALLTFIIAWLLTKHYRWVMASLITLLFYSMVFSQISIRQKNNTAICIYQLPRQTAIQFINGNSSWWFTSKDAISDSYTSKFVADANFFWGTQKNSYNLLERLDTLFSEGPIYYESGFWKFGNVKGMFVGSGIPNYLNLTDSLKLDLLLVTGKPSYGINVFSPKLSFNQVVIDGSVPAWQTNQWAVKDAKNNVYLTNEMGAFMMPLP